MPKMMLHAPNLIFCEVSLVNLSIFIEMKKVHYRIMNEPSSNSILDRYIHLCGIPFKVSLETISFSGYGLNNGTDMVILPCLSTCLQQKETGTYCGIFYHQSVKNRKNDDRQSVYHIASRMNIIVFGLMVFCRNMRVHVNIKRREI